MIDIERAEQAAYNEGYRRGVERGKPKWIPITDRLPELHIEYEEPHPYEQADLITSTYWISDPVLVTGTSKSTDDSPIFVAMYEDDGFGRTYWNDAFGGTLENVTAWMPLPEPYKESERR